MASNTGSYPVPNCHRTASHKINGIQHSEIRSASSRHAPGPAVSHRLVRSETNKNGQAPIGSAGLWLGTADIELNLLEER